MRVIWHTYGSNVVELNCSSVGAAEQLIGL
jgi:hypothetical protein